MHISPKFELEGVMAKRLGAPYQAGVRSKDWLKIKHLQNGTFVVVGWKPAHQKERANLGEVGSLLLARPDTEGTWRCVGRVGTGFTSAQRRDYAAKLKLPEISLPAAAANSNSQVAGVTKAEAEGVIWVQPQLKAKVEFAEWTTADPDDPKARLRHPRWRGWA
jgi:bifunctional non-homologous end joining protein LigD